MAAKVIDGVKGEREREFVLYCARADSDEETTAHARTLLQKGLDRDRLLRLALQERVMPLLYRWINENSPEAFPAEFVERLRDHFYANAARNHLLADELCACLELFEKNGVQAVAYKGPVLAKDIYGDVAMRQFSDLDLMIRAEDVSRAYELLGSRGYSKEHELTRAEESAFRKIECEQVLYKMEGRVYLDLHWGFAPLYFPLELDPKLMWNRLERVSFGRGLILSFAPEDLLLILSVNACKDFWQPLSRICDVAEFIRAHKGLDWDRVLERAKLAGARRILFTTLLLAEDLLKTNLPEHISERMYADRKTRAFAESVRQKLFQDKEEAGGEVGKFLRPSKAMDSWRDRVRFHLRLGLTPTPEDWTFIKLPRGARFLYYLTRPIRLAKKYLLHH